MMLRLFVVVCTSIYWLLLKRAVGATYHSEQIQTLREPVKQTYYDTKKVVVNQSMKPILLKPTLYAPDAIRTFNVNDSRNSSHTPIPKHIVLA